MSHSIYKRNVKYVKDDKLSSLHVTNVIFKTTTYLQIENAK